MTVFGADGKVTLADICDIHTVNCYGGVFQSWSRRRLHEDALELFAFEDRGGLPVSSQEMIPEERSLAGGSCPTEVLFPCIDVDCFDSCEGFEMPICLLSQANCLLSTLDGFAFPFLSDLPGVAMMLFGQTSDVELVRFVSPLLVFSAAVSIPIPIPPVPGLTIIIDLEVSSIAAACFVLSPRLSIWSSRLSLPRFRLQSRSNWVSAFCSKDLLKLFWSTSL